MHGAVLGPALRWHSSGALSAVYTSPVALGPTLAYLQSGSTAHAAPHPFRSHKTHGIPVVCVPLPPDPGNKVLDVQTAGAYGGGMHTFAVEWARDSITSERKFGLPAASACGSGWSGCCGKTGWASLRT